MADTSYTLGGFIADLMRKAQHSNVSLAAIAGVSEGVIRNLLKVGIDPKAKDQEPRTLRRIADALGINAIMLFRLAGYLPPQAASNSVRADYLADIFDELAPEKQDAVLGVIESMTDRITQKHSLEMMRDQLTNPLAGIELNFPQVRRLLANQLIAHYQMTQPMDVQVIEPDVTIHGTRWNELPVSLKQQVISLVRYKLSLEYNPAMVEPEWRE